MSQAFTFNFDSDDIEDDAAGDESQKSIDGEPLVAEKEAASLLHPRLISLEDLLATLPSKISYSTHPLTATATNPIPRRDLFDIRLQLMAEDSITSAEHPLLDGLTTDDINPSIYEGGFKTWECSLDLARYLTRKLEGNPVPTPKHLHIIELGAGTALPTSTLLSHLLTNPLTSTTMTLTDYNSPVLHLSTLPNILLTWASHKNLLLTLPTGDLPLPASLLSTFAHDLASQNIRIAAIAGAWSPAFVDLIPAPDVTETLVLASETIYEPRTLKSFTSTLLAVLAASQSRSVPFSRSRALIAAKKMYFGVGGGVDQFLEVLREMGGRGKVVWEEDGEGIGRCILEVEGGA
ncbi:hypothetical protein MMC12_005852 [Toensbergia leucococca]|nr:hypothetical protein [Toensbergia leucococca]